MKAKIIPVTKKEFLELRQKCTHLGIPTRFECEDPDKVIYDLVWLRELGQNLRIDRSRHD